MNHQAATVPTFYFIGVTTASSSIMQVFPKWAQALNLNAVIVGIDLPLHAPIAAYRECVDFIKHDPLSLGALVTTHKIDLYNACRDMFDYVDPYAQKLSEVSSLSKRDGRFCAHAKDPISSGLALEHFVPRDHFRDHPEAQALLMGAGGSSLAMCLYFAQTRYFGGVPREIILANRSQTRLDSAKEILADLNPDMRITYALCPEPQGNDAIISTLSPHSLIVNATGLGKDAPGSPTTDEVDYPEHALVWEINYRGDLLFMRQALDQKAAKHLIVEDGWVYFIHGWSQVISEVFNIELTPNIIALLSDIAGT